MDEDLKPWLLEVNHTPSFSTDSALDLVIKKTLLSDTITMAFHPLFSSQYFGGFYQIFPNNGELEKTKAFLAFKSKEAEPTEANERMKKQGITNKSGTQDSSLKMAQKSEKPNFKVKSIRSGTMQFESQDDPFSMGNDQIKTMNNQEGPSCPFKDSMGFPNNKKSKNTSSFRQIGQIEQETKSPRFEIKANFTKTDFHYKAEKTSAFWRESSPKSSQLCQAILPKPELTIEMQNNTPSYPVSRLHRPKPINAALSRRSNPKAEMIASIMSKPRIKLIEAHKGETRDTYSSQKTSWKAPCSNLIYYPVWETVSPPDQNTSHPIIDNIPFENSLPEMHPRSRPSSKPQEGKLLAQLKKDKTMEYIAKWKKTKAKNAGDIQSQKGIRPDPQFRSLDHDPLNQSLYNSFKSRNESNPTSINPTNPPNAIQKPVVSKDIPKSDKKLSIHVIDFQNFEERSPRPPIGFRTQPLLQMRPKPNRNEERIGLGPAFRSSNQKGQHSPKGKNETRSKSKRKKMNLQNIFQPSQTVSVPFARIKDDKGDFGFYEKLNGNFSE